MVSQVKLAPILIQYSASTFSCLHSTAST